MSDINERTSDWIHAQEWAADLNDDLLQDISSGAVSFQPAEADNLLLKHAKTLLKASAVTSARGKRAHPRSWIDSCFYRAERLRLNHVTRYTQTLRDVLARVKQHKIDLVQTERPDDRWNDAYTFSNALQPGPLRPSSFTRAFGPGMSATYERMRSRSQAWDKALVLIHYSKHNVETQRVAKLDSEEVLQLPGQHAVTLQTAAGVFALGGGRTEPRPWEGDTEDEIQRSRFYSVDWYSRRLKGVLLSIKQYKVDLTKVRPTDVSDRRAFETGMSSRLASFDKKLLEAKTWDVEFGGHDATFAVFYEGLCTANAVRSLLLLKKSLPDTIQENCKELRQEETTGYLRPGSQALRDIEARLTEISSELDMLIDEQGAWQAWVAEAQNQLSGSMTDVERENKLDGVRLHAVFTDPDRLIGDYTLAEVESLLRQASEVPYDTIRPRREEPRFNCIRRPTEPDVGSSAGSKGQ